MKTQIISAIVFILVMFILTKKGIAAEAPTPPIITAEEFVARYKPSTVLGHVFAVKSIVDGPAGNDSYTLTLKWVGGEDLKVEVHTLVPNIVGALPGKTLLDTAAAAHAPFRQVDGYEGNLAPLMVQIFPMKVAGGELQLVPIFTLIDRVLLQSAFDGYIHEDTDTLFWNKSDDSDSRAYLVLLSMIHLRTIERVANNVGHKVTLKMPVQDLGGLGDMCRYVSAVMTMPK